MGERRFNLLGQCQPMTLYGERVPVVHNPIALAGKFLTKRDF
ncbi:MAG TPA: hypothetical protein V6C98_14070 [Thermosynechococcaceae cyanobacterium]